MAEARYKLCDAAADLRAAGLLDRVWLCAGETWRIADEASLPGTFRGAALDSRRVASGELFVALAGEKSDGRDFIDQALAAGAHALTGPAPTDPAAMKSPAADAAVVLVSPRPRLALAELARCWRDRRQALVLAVTGSNGKTTTKDLLAALLAGAGPTLATAGNLNNELGLPLTLLGLGARHRFAVIEMGASAVGEIARLAGWTRPQIGVITNAAEAHLAEFGSLDGVVQGKGELLDALPREGTAVLNADSIGYKRWCERARCQVVSFSGEPGTESATHHWRWQPDLAGGGGRLQLDDAEWAVPLPGRHNAANLSAAILAARAAGASDAEMRTGLANFAASPHRSRLLRVAGWQLLDDSYNANPASMRSATEALLALPGAGSIAVLGTMAELGPASDEIHRSTGQALRQLGLQRLLAVGAEAAALADGFIAAGGEAQRCATRSEAVAWLRAQAAPGDRVLIKGSRSAAMDEIVSEIVGDSPQQPAPDQGAE